MINLKSDLISLNIFNILSVPFLNGAYPHEWKKVGIEKSSSLDLNIFKSVPHL